MRTQTARVANRAAINAIVGGNLRCQHHRALGGDAERGRRALRAGQQRGRGVPGPADPGAGHGARHRPPRPRHRPHARLSDEALRNTLPRQAFRARAWASTRTKFWPNWATTPGTAGGLAAKRHDLMQPSFGAIEAARAPHARNAGCSAHARQIHFRQRNTPSGISVVSTISPQPQA